MEMKHPIAPPPEPVSGSREIFKIIEGLITHSERVAANAQNRLSPLILPDSIMEFEENSLKAAECVPEGRPLPPVFSEMRAGLMVLSRNLGAIERLIDIVDV